MDGQTYWEQVGYQKDFEDPFPLEKLTSLLPKNAKVYDYSSKMIERGKALNPHLKLEYISKSGYIPLSDASADCLIASTILCCLPAKEELRAPFQEFYRILKPGGTLYLFDFLLSQHASSQKKYEAGLNQHGEWGVYTTNEGLKVRHFKTAILMELLEAFDIQWFEQLDFKTMNNNPALVVQCFVRR